MSTRKPLLVVKNTRRVTVRLVGGITPERFLYLLNQRHVKLVNDQLTDGDTGAVLAQREGSVNVADYVLAHDQNPVEDFDTLDLFDFHYNQI